MLGRIGGCIYVALQMFPRVVSSGIEVGMNYILSPAVNGGHLRGNGWPA